MSTGRARSLPSKSKKKKKRATSKRKRKEKGKKKREKRKKKEEEEQLRQAHVQPMCNCTWAFLSKNNVQFFPLIFSQFWGEKYFLMGLGSKHLCHYIYFLSFSPNQKHSKKFSFLFSLQNFLSALFHLQTNTP